MADLEQWFCELHQVWTTTDCPRCDDEQIADLERYAEAGVRDSHAPGHYFVDLDGDLEPTIWQRTDREDYPEPMLRLCDIPPRGRHIWPLIVAAVTGGVA